MSSILVPCKSRPFSRTAFFGFLYPIFSQKRLPGTGPAVIIALNKIRSQQQNLLLFLFFLHTFDDNAQVNAVYHIDNMAQKLPLIAVLQRPQCKTPVDLDDIRIKQADVLQIGIAGAEIVKGNLNPRLLELCHTVCTLTLFSR